MKTTTKALLLLAACALPLLAQQAPPATLVQQDAPAAESKPAPGWLEGLLYNPAERTREGAAALDAGAPAAASEALDAAMRLDPASDKARYNAGTARLLASSEEAAPLLESAAKSTDQALAARAFYNLGNSRLEGEDYKGAIEAYKDSLRRDPASADAKFNLELALRRLQEKQQNQQNQNQQNQDQQKEDQQNQEQQQQQQGQGQQDQQQQEEQQQGEQKKDGQEQQQEKQQEQQGQGEQKQQDQQQQQQKQQQGKGEQGPLPQFKDLPDMDAQQAAAILEAIENLERTQRRDDAKKALKANASGKKDW
jgi:Ca-activated chloride channel family protein